MLGQTFIILSEDERLEKIVAALLPGIRVVLCESIDQLLPSLGLRGPRILLDPLCATPGRLEEIRRLERRRDAPLMPGVESSRGQECGVQRSLSDARTAWVNRARVLEPVGRSEAARSFLRAAREHDRRGYTIPEAAASVGVSVRQLRRISRGALGHAPGVVIHLARIVSVAAELERGELPLATIARSHGFTDRPGLNRLFARFIAEPPSVFKARELLLRLRKPRHLAEIANGPCAPFRVLEEQHT